MKTLSSIMVAAALAAQVSAQTPASNPAQQAEVLYRQGLAAEKAGDPIAAQNAYMGALKANPKHANAQYSLGQLKISWASVATKGREAKFGAILIPEFRLDAATLQEALDALQSFVEKQSKNTVVPNFIIQDPQHQLTGIKISLNLKSMPSKGVLQYLMEQAGAKARFDEHAIVITPIPK